MFSLIRLGFPLNKVLGTRTLRGFNRNSPPRVENQEDVEVANDGTAAKINNRNGTNKIEKNRDFEVDDNSFEEPRSFNRASNRVSESSPNNKFTADYNDKPDYNKFTPRAAHFESVQSDSGYNTRSRGFSSRGSNFEGRSARGDFNNSRSRFSNDRFSQRGTPDRSFYGQSNSYERGPSGGRFGSSYPSSRSRGRFEDSFNSRGNQGGFQNSFPPRGDRGQRENSYQTRSYPAYDRGSFAKPRGRGDFNDRSDFPTFQDRGDNAQTRYPRASTNTRMTTRSPDIPKYPFKEPKFKSFEEEDISEIPEAESNFDPENISKPVFKKAKPVSEHFFGSPNFKKPTNNIDEKIITKPVKPIPKKIERLSDKDDNFYIYVRINNNKTSEPKKISEFKFSDVIQSNLNELKIEDATPIQIAAFGPILYGKSTYICSQTGTGKTLAYLLPLIKTIKLPLTEEEVNEANKEITSDEPSNPEATENEEYFSRVPLNSLKHNIIIIVPNLSLVKQTLDVIHAVTAKTGITVSNLLSMHDLIGQSGSHFAVTTPKRFFDLIEFNKFDKSAVQKIVIDEADMILFECRPKIFSILGDFSSSEEGGKKFQTVLVSATLPNTEIIADLRTCLPRFTFLKSDAHKLLSEITYTFHKVMQEKKLGNDE